jgi:catechol-2,3-dioxygenase
MFSPLRISIIGAMNEITRLGHVVLAASNPERLAAFYADALGLQLVETDRDFGLTFLSSHPDEVNHDLSFTKQPKLAHIAYEVDSLATLKRLHHDLTLGGVKIVSTMNFGWSIGFTFEDPEGNRCELYWSTGSHNPGRAPIDLTLPDAEIERIVDSLDRSHQPRQMEIHHADRNQ